AARGEDCGFSISGQGISGSAGTACGHSLKPARLGKRTNLLTADNGYPDVFHASCPGTESHRESQGPESWFDSQDLWAIGLIFGLFVLTNRHDAPSTSRNASTRIRDSRTRTHG